MTPPTPVHVLFNLNISPYLPRLLYVPNVSPNLLLIYLLIYLLLPIHLSSAPLSPSVVMSVVLSYCRSIAALTVGNRPENKGKTIVVIIPSFGERYVVAIRTHHINTNTNTPNQYENHHSLTHTSQY